MTRVDDVDATPSRIVKHGRIIQPSGRIGKASPGYDAYFLDPNGNEMGLYSDRAPKLNLNA